MAQWKLVSKHEYEFISAVPIYGRALGFFVMGLAVTAGGVALLVIGIAGGSIAPCLLGGGITFFGLPVIAVGLWLWPWQRVRWARAYEEGLRWKTGSRVHKKRWEEVTSVGRTEEQTVGPDGERSAFGRTAHLSLRFADDTSVRFDPSLTNYDRLARYVQEAVASRQHAAATAEMDEAGKTFGLMHVARGGVTVNGRHFPWKEVKWLSVDNGELCAHPSCTAWEPVPLAAIPNYLLLLSLLKGMGRLRE